MKKIYSRSRKILLVLSFCSYSVAAQKTLIKGKVVDEITSRPLPGVTVTLSGTSFKEETNEEGDFVFPDVSLPGEHILIFSKNVFLEKRFPIMLSGNPIDLEIIYLRPDIGDRQQTGTISLSESELDEEDGGYANISGLLQATKDVFLNAAAFDFSQTFFRPRGYDSEFGKLLINGVEMNKFFNGRPQWSNWGGLNDVQRDQDFSMGSGPSDVSFGSLAGTTNISMRASKYTRGGRFSYALANRTYTGRLMGSYHSGLTEEGWAFSVSLSRRFAEESYIDGSIYDANSFFTSVEKKINEQHSLNFTTFYTPNRRGKNSPNTSEVYDLRGNRYNSYWGYQDGEIRNSRERIIQEPVFMLNHYWDLSEKTELNTNVAYQFGKVGNSRIDYGGSRLVTGPNGEEIFIGGGSNPDPSYYQKMPSYFLRFEDVPDYRAAYLAREEFENDGQIDWPAMYLANETATSMGGNSLYVLYDDRNDDKQISANTILRKALSDRLTLNAALNFRNLTSHNYAAVLDLLGGNSFLDVDSFSEGEEAQNDLLNPNRLVAKGDAFKYDFDMDASTVSGFAQMQAFLPKFDLYAAVDLSSTGYQRTGYFKNGNFPNNSLGKSDHLQFQNYGFKGGVTYKYSGRHLFNANLSHFTKPPTLRNSFSNSRQNNETVRGLNNESIFTADVGYILRSPVITGRITGFYGQFLNGTEISFYYADGLSGLGRNSTTAFVQEVLTGINKKHLGLEAGVEVKVTATIKLKAAGAFGEYLYSNNPHLYLTSDDFTNSLDMGRSYIKNYRLPGGPQQAAQIGFEYRDPDFWWFSATANFFSKAFVDFAPLSRSKNFFTDSDGLPIVGYDEDVAKEVLKQEELEGYTLVNIVGGKSWKIRNKFFGIFASLNNILNADYRTGGFEQSRNVNYHLLKTDKEREQPIFGPKYWFGPGTTYYTHVYFRF
ncbi:carboxypeptidase-like regulatory domain-containing protein [Salinimicrobium flavum]|uniref:Carboxypeptidase-like regulatory domain-containing protein n=1 Tax=Salinimicrobium flavum TaxID=1737065 RepID=A0ABW5IU44_9FLAO